MPILMMFLSWYFYFQLILESIMFIEAEIFWFFPQNLFSKSSLTYNVFFNSWKKNTLFLDIDRNWEISYTFSKNRLKYPFDHLIIVCNYYVNINNKIFPECMIYTMYPCTKANTKQTRLQIQLRGSWTFTAEWWRVYKIKFRFIYKDIRIEKRIINSDCIKLHFHTFVPRLGPNPACII